MTSVVRTLLTSLPVATPPAPLGITHIVYSPEGLYVMLTNSISRAVQRHNFTLHWTYRDETVCAERRSLKRDRLKISGHVKGEPSV